MTPKHPGTTLPDVTTMFSYLPPSFKKNVNNTLTMIYQMDYRKIENLHLDLQESRELHRTQKIESKQIKELKISSPPLTANHFQDNSSTPPDLQSEILAFNNPVPIQEELIELEKHPPYCKSLDTFQFHALSYNLYGFYSARIQTPENVSSEFENMRMIFKYNLKKKIEYFALLPFHEYKLFNAIVSRANNLKEASTFFDKYNKYCFNRAMKVGDKYKYLLKKCIKLQFSEYIIYFVIDERYLFLDFFKSMSSEN